MQRQEALARGDLEPHSLVKFGQAERGGGYFQSVEIK